MDAEFHDPISLMNKRVSTPRGTGMVRHYNGIYVYVIIGEETVKTHWAHCEVVA